MTYERFKQIWDKLVPNPALPKSPLNMSPRLEAALIAEANVDHSAFDAIQHHMTPPTPEQLAAERTLIDKVRATVDESRARMNTLTPAQREEHYLRGMQMIYAKWWPIESAPKDGTYILLAGPSGYIGTPLRVQVCRWDPVYRPLNPWQTYANDSFEDTGQSATLWMPLPSAP